MSNLSRLIRIRCLNFHCLRSSHGIVHVQLLLLFLLAATPYTTEQSSADSSQYHYGFNNGIDPSMTVIILVLVCSFFFMGFFTIYIRQCTENSAVVNSRSSAAAADGLPRGLDPAIIEVFPIFVYSKIKDVKIGRGALECAVCLSEFEDDENLRLLPKCDHVFHPECIDAWFASHTTCPVCRADLTLISGEIAGVLEQKGDSNDFADKQCTRSELSELQDHVSINIEYDRFGDSKQKVEITNRMSETLKQSRRHAEKFRRSHSTGHSLVQAGENCDRFTLRLPEEVWKQILTQRLKRTTSCVVAFRREGSSRRGYRSDEEVSSHGRRAGLSDRIGNSGRWVFKMTPPFFMRTGSVKSVTVCADQDVR